MNVILGEDIFRGFIFNASDKKTYEWMGSSFLAYIFERKYLKPFDISCFHIFLMNLLIDLVFIF